jgi:putative Holliday junction resolvase
VTQRTRLLGVDFGTVRVGLAVSDPDLRLASPLATYTRANSERDEQFFRQLVDDEQIAAIIVGLPVHLNGREGDKARQARAFGQWLVKVTGLPVHFYDERFTTVEAEQFLQDAGLTSKRRKARRDRVAAQILLQSYLEAGCPTNQDVGPLDGSLLEPKE